MEVKKLKEKGIAYVIELQNLGRLGEDEVKAFKKSEMDKIAILDESTMRQEKIQNNSDALEEKRQAKLEAQRKAQEEAKKKAQEKIKKVLTR